MAGDAERDRHDRGGHRGDESGAAVVAQAWAPGQIERTPLDTDNLTHLSGAAQVAGGPDLELQQTPVLAWSGNQVEFGFFVDHFTFIAGLLFAAVHGPGERLALQASLLNRSSVSA